MKKKVLFLNHTRFRCGVQQFGKLIAQALLQSEKIDLSYKEVEAWSDVKDPEQYDILIFNYHDQTMKWLCDEITMPLAEKGKKLFCITGHDHFANFNGARNIVADPSGVDDEKTFYTGRVLPDISVPPAPKNDIPVIGSFGFGFYQKNFGRLVGIVNEQFDEAVIRLHIPANDFADAGGGMSSMFLSAAGAQVKPGIRFEASSQFLGTAEMVLWLSQNDLNLFVYDQQPGRGISSAVDFAIAARKPVGISKSEMFRHIYHDERILVEKTPLKTIIANGFEPLEKYYHNWSPSALTARYEEIFEK